MFNDYFELFPIIILVGLLLFYLQSSRSTIKHRALVHVGPENIGMGCPNLVQKGSYRGIPWFFFLMVHN